MSFKAEDYITFNEHDEILLSYNGRITSDLINNTLHKTEQILLENKETNRLRKKVYNVLIESLQNLYHHSEGIPEDMRISYHENQFGTFHIIKIENGYKIVTTNFVEEDKKEMLIKKLDEIKQLSEDKLKEMYKFVLNHQKLSKKGGGGMGLIDIAKKTKNNIDYRFHKYKDNWYLFIFTIIVY